MEMKWLKITCEEGTVVEEENVLIDLFLIKDEYEVSYMSVLDDRYTSPLFNAATVLIKSICLST
jgi:hypothetical protein